MKYAVTINGKQYEVEVERLSSGLRPMTRSTQRTVAPAPVVEKTEPAPAPKVEPKAPAAAPVASGEGTNVESPMPGKILDIRVNEGDSVSEGQVIIILEAMKMENEIVSPASGVVSTINVKKGEMVDTDGLLAVIK